MENIQKRIVICCDGTWNEPDKNPTNVIKMVRAVKPFSDDGIHQVVFYDQGVGTGNKVDKFIGGSVGKGLAKNVLDAYRFLVHNYQTGDEIFCFGFSRGAYTARALGGMLSSVGLLPKEELENLTAAYQYYRTPPHKRSGHQYEDYYRPDIKMIGVFDTVGALGAPTPILGKMTKKWVGFFNTHLSPYVKNAFHALAIDEKRAPFKADLWTGSINSDQTVEQTWFAGVHSDIGGGYPETGLSDITLMWMIEKAQALGLQFSRHYLSDTSKINPSVAGTIHESYSKPYRWLEKITGNGVRLLEGNPDNPPINVSIHESVIERMRMDIGYDPKNFSKKLPIAKTEERRSQVRYSTHEMPGTLEFHEQLSTCKIIDFNPLGGVKIQSDVTLTESDPVVVSSSQFAKTLATCVWKKGNTYGLKFAA